jgi:UDP-GlcNAc:undecaprenyl-phosphate GlcNAc-1-phosphate transferase
MDVNGALALGFALSCVLAYAATPVAIRVAHRFDFHDKPGGYKGHGRVTPYLGGSAVMAAFLAATLLLAGSYDRTLPLLVGVVVMWAIGTLDDRRNVSWVVRVAVEAGLAAMLFAAGLGWELGLGGGVDLAVTVLWVLAVVNALNLFDNMDGQASTMAVVISGALAVFGAIEGDRWLAVGGAALCGASLGFLPHNLARPSRIFLGDGGSMPIGFALAALVMAGAADAAPAWQALAIGMLLVGVLALDTALVIISRRRRGISVLTGGRDHLTHRTRRRLRTAQAVAVALGSAQALLAAMALAAGRESPIALVGAVVVFLAVAGVIITLLDAPTQPADDRDEAPSVVGASQRHENPERTDRRVPREALLLVPLGLACGLSPLASGYYSSAVWAPAGLVLIVILIAAAIVRPPALALRGVVALTALGGLAVLSLVSSFWSDSAQQAFEAGNRYVLYAVALGLMLVLVRGSAQGAWLLGGFAAGAALVAGTVLIDFAAGNGADLFVAGRLHEPLGYINAIGSFFALALWPAVALAERRNAFVAGAGAAAAVALAPLMLLTVSRGVALAVLGSAVIVLATVPGRVRRAWLFAVLAAAVAPIALAAYDVYDAAQAAGGLVDAALLVTVAERTAVAAILAGLLWAGVVRAADRPWASALRRPATGVVVGVLVLAVVGMLVNAGRITDEVSRQADAFVSLGGAEAGGEAGSRLVSGGGNRYEYWRVAWEAWADEPLTGVGAGNYDAVYLRERRISEDVRQPHSLALQLLSEVGVGGALLFVALLVALAAGVRRSAVRARAGGIERSLAVAATGMVAVWVVHTTVEWVYLMPGLTVAVLAAGAVLLRRGADEGRPAARLRPVAVVIVAAVLAVSGVLLARQVMSERFERQARHALADSPARALDLADRALRLDPELLPAHYTRAAALARFGRAEAARAALLDAVAREPEDFLTYALLGDLAVRMGDTAEARRWYSEALERNPREPSIRRARDELDATGG